MHGNESTMLKRFVHFLKLTHSKSDLANKLLLFYTVFYANPDGAEAIHKRINARI
jgi:hypothetical protein